MSYDFLGIENVTKESLESITGDETVGQFTSIGENLRGQATFDVARFRRAIIAYEEEFEGRTMEIGLIRWGDNENRPPILAMVPRGGANRAIVLAPRVGAGDWDGDERDPFEQINGENNG